MLSDMHLWTTIRHALFVEKISKRAACKRFGLSFRTIQKVAAHPEPGSYHRRPPSATTISPFLSHIEGYLTEDKSQPRKQHHTCKRIYERLRDEQGYTGSYRTVCLTVAELRQQAKTLYIPLAHPLGHAQFDFGFADAVIGGVRQQVAYASISLPYSNVRYVQAFPRECTETFQESLIRFFRFLGGVPSLISFDNSKVNVAKIVCGRGKSPSEGLLQLESHYLFQHHFCRVRQPQEKGHVENAVNYLRSNFMVPVPNFPSFAAFNEYLEQQCREEFAKTSSMQEKSIGELFAEERPSLLPLPDMDFEARRIESRRANTLALVRFDRNDYSVPGEHAHKQLTVVGSVATVKFLVDGDVVAIHDRDWRVKQTQYNPIHYLAIAERRPNGLDFGAPFASWELPGVYDVLRRRLETQAGKQGKREYIRILRLLERFSLEQLTIGIERALASNTTAYEGVRLYVECAATVPVELFSLDGRPLLQQVTLPEPDIQVYSSLLESNSYEKIRNEANGSFETPLTAVETAEFRAGMRGDGVAMCEREHRSPGVPASIIGAGTLGSGSPGGRATVESSEVPWAENTGNIRLQESTVAQQDVGQPVDARRVHRTKGVDYLDRTTGNGKDASGDGIGNSSMPDGKEGKVLPSERSHYATIGGEGRTTTDTIEEESRLVGSLDIGRTGLCPGKQGGQ
jgi:transposase